MICPFCGIETENPHTDPGCAAAIIERNLEIKRQSITALDHQHRQDCENDIQAMRVLRQNYAKETT